MTHDLVFVTAQPDVPYFHWQVKVYSYNFIEMGIDPNQIHVIFAMVNGNTEPTKESLELKSMGINVHHYLDTRHQKHYIPNIKPFLIYKWLEQFPEIGKCFFLHDADIIFRKLPDLETLLSDDITYLSDTVGYIGYNYINDCCNRYEKHHPTSNKGQLIQEMVDVVGVSVDCVKCNQENSGGGQYIIKNTDSFIWNKIYEDCTPLYDQMMSYQKRFPISSGEIQFWTAEMWSLLWNGWKNGFKTECHPDLSFCWAPRGILEYERHSIFHNAGIQNNMQEEYFYKYNYISKLPYYEDIRIKENTASYEYWKEVKKTGENTVLF